jgi:phosphate transport system protein
VTLNAPSAAAPARIDDLRVEIVRLGSLAAASIPAASQAFADGDLEEATRVITDDDEVDAQRHGIEDECLHLLGSGWLDAHGVRFVASTLRVAHELERTADLMVNVARTTWRLHPAEVDQASRDLVRRLGRQAALQVRVAVNAFVDGDLSSAAALVDMDDSIDDMHDLLLRRALVRSSDQVDDATVLRAVQLTLVARHYERAGDHAVTIGGFVPFVVTGRH